MWTPKRILLLAAGFLGFTLAYLAYSMTTLGRINTLPPLPERYRSNPGTQPEFRPPEATSSPLKIKLERAFGKECKEKSWPVQLELNAKSMVMAAEDFKLEPDGRVLLLSMSLALFGKKKNDSQDVEINTLRCSRAYITFDRAVASLSPGELSGRKVVEAELSGEGRAPIVIVNNRRTSRPDDDLTVIINRGPLHYNETKQLIWTNDLVEVKDGCPLPKAHIVAKGMVMSLATTAPPPRPGAPIANKPKSENISGVKQIVLKQDVTMHLYVSGGTPFPSGDNKQPAPTAENKTPPAATAAKASPPPPSHIIIRTPGRFQYDLFKDHDLARFDVPDDAGQAGSPQDVTVQRVTKEDAGSDQLVCKHLELRLKRHSADASPSGAATTANQSPEQQLEIEWAHATGPYVTLTSDAEKLDAHGNDFFHDAAKKLTILKGTPFMEANKEGSLIQAPELRIQDVPLPVAAKESNKKSAAAKTYQQIQATGPGSVHMLNKDADKPTTHAEWKDKLISTKDGELDLLILTGQACFTDEEHHQSLQAETLKVWLLAEEKKVEVVKKKPDAEDKKPEKKDATANKSPAPQQSRRPHHIEALRNVKSFSRELNIHDTSRLLVRFTDVPFDRLPPEKKPPAKANPQPQPKPAATDAARPAAPTSPATPSTTVAAKAKTTPAPAQAKAADAPPADPDAPRPIDMTARSIEAEVLRCGERMVLDHLWAEGSPVDNKGGVRVRQESANKGERGVYIEGNTLNMKCYPDGHVLDVTGDLAQLLMDKMLILGPEVHIDQTLNQASVRGEGAMQMQSTQTLDGKPLYQMVDGKKVPRTVPLTVHWSEYMVFAGEHAEFLGGIQATQENARLACQHLQVYFDRPISLKEGAKGDQPAKVRNLVGDKDVRIEDKTLVLGELQKYQLMTGSSVTMYTVPRDDDELSHAGSANKDNSKSGDANEVTLSGSPHLPGSVRILQRGGSDLNVTPGRPAPNRTIASKHTADEQQMKMTYIRFERIMKASSRTNTASFWQSVRVLNFPCKPENVHRDIDLDVILSKGLPEGAMYLRCNRLKVHTYERRNEKGEPRTYQEMEAHDKILVQAKEFLAQSDHMTFNEEKDQVIFIGENGHQAVLEKRYAKGQPPQVFRAHRITYIRSTGMVRVSNGDSIDGN